MAISLNSFTPNTKIESSKVNTNFTNVKTAIEDASYRAFSWGFVGGVGVENSQGMRWIATQNLTVKTLYAKTTSGTCTIRIKADSTEIHAGFAVTSTIGNTSSFAATTITAGQLVTIDVTAAATCVDLYVMLETQPTTIA